jgi:hypothetical protein
MMTTTRTLLCLVAVAVAAPGAQGSERARDAFVFSCGTGNLYSTNVDIDEALRVRKIRSGEFLWFRRARRAYLVTDPTLLAQGREILQPSQALSREQEAVSARLRPFEAREEELEAEQERLEDRMGAIEDDEGAAAAEQRRQLGEKQRALEARRRELEADMRPIEAEERALDDREREIERVADAAIVRLIDGALRRGLASPLR